MKKINKLFADYTKLKHRLTTFQNEVKRDLCEDEKGYFFILNKEKERITDPQEIERIEQFLNIK